MYSKSEQIEIMKSAGYSESSAKQALNIGVIFFDSLDQIKDYEKEYDFKNLNYDKGILNDKEVYFIDETIAI